MRDAGHRTPDIGQRTAKKAKIIYPPPRGVDIITLLVIKRYYDTVMNISLMSKRNISLWSMTGCFDLKSVKTFSKGHFP